MPNYGQKYTATFSALSNSSINYELQIFKKDYTGSVIPITLGADACVQEWVDDDYLKEIKSSFLKIHVINDGTISLEDFYSSFDDDFLVYLYRTDVDYILLFSGYLSFDDLSDIAVQYAHDFYLVATDGLSFLKEIPFDKAAILNGTEFTDENLNVNINKNIIKINNYIYPYINIKAGSYITIQIGTAIYSNILVNEVGTALANPDGGPNDSDPYVYIDIAYNFSTPLNNTNIDLTYTLAYNINKYLKLSEIFKLCLKSLPISKEEFRVIGNLKPSYVDRFLDETYLHVSSLIDNGEYLDCYSIMEKICKSFSAVLMSNGAFYYFIRWGELPTHINEDLLRPSHRYDSNFDFIVSGNESSDFFIDLKNSESGAIKNIIKPYTYVKSIFNFTNQDDNILYNADLSITPILFDQWLGGTFGDDFIQNYSYESEGFTSYTPNTQFAVTNAYINVNTQLYTDIENTRVLAIPYPVYTTGYHSVKCNPIKVQIGDVIEFSFEIRTLLEQYENSSYKVPFDIVLSDGTNTYYGIGNEQPKAGSFPVTYLQAGQWYQYDSAGTENHGYQYRGDGNFNAAEWQTINIKLYPAPISGDLIFCFSSIANGVDGNNETYIRNISCKKNANIYGFNNFKGFASIAKYEVNNNLFYEKESPYGYSPDTSIKNNFFINGDDPSNVTKAQNWEYIPYPNDYNIYNETISSFDNGSGRFYINVFGQNYTGNPPINNYYYPNGTTFTITNSTGGVIDGTYTIDNISTTRTNDGIEYFVIYLDGTEIPVDYDPGTATLTMPSIQKYLLSDIDARELMVLRSQPSTKLDINIIDIISGTTDISVLSPLNIIFWAYSMGFDLGVFYIIGSLEINYKSNQAKCTLYGLIYELDRTYKEINLRTNVTHQYIKN